MCHLSYAPPNLSTFAPLRLSTIQVFATLQHLAAVRLHICAASTLGICCPIFMRCNVTVSFPQPTHFPSRIGNSALSRHSVLQKSELTSRRLNAYTLVLVSATSLSTWRPHKLHSRTLASMRFCALAESP